MKLINKKDNQITFTAEIDESLANAIRRYLNQILVLAIDEVEISKNDSPLYDETIAHRMGLIPLKMDKASDEKTTEEITLVADKEGIVYSGEMKGHIKPAYEDIPITVLKKGQELEILATARTGRGSKHSKFSPGLMFYRNFVEIKLDKTCPEGVVDVCPQKILKVEDNKTVSVDEHKCDMCEACVDFCKKKGKSGIELTPGKELVVTIESFGQLTTEEIFKKAIKALKEDLVDISKKISK